MSAEYLFAPESVPVANVVGETKKYPVRRIFCVGRNYAEHAKEMGSEVDREAPWYFLKSASALVRSGATIPYALETKNFHYEMELVIALGAPAFRVSVDQALNAVYGYATGLDMTRRDLQMAAREKQRPWDFGKDFEKSAILGDIVRKENYAAIGPQRICLKVGETIKQDAHLTDLVWSVPEIVSHLSRFYHLGAGDLIYTGTPAGVGPVSPGDVVRGDIDGLPPVIVTIGAAE
jgi:fumarylpyruvate hydrolase